MSSNPGEKLKILAIHGYRQNAEVFRKKTGSFRKLVHKWAEFTYITAPHKVVTVEKLDDIEKFEENPEVETEEYGWFFNRDNLTFRGIRQGGPAIGFEESILAVEKAFEKYGPFDGLLGFSQGGCFVGLLCDLQQKGLLSFKFDFAIMASGFKSRSLPHMKYYSEPLRIPILSVYGESDNIIPKEMSEELEYAFLNVTSVVHPGKHYLPAAAPQKSDYQNFFEEQYTLKQTRRSS